MRLAHREEVYDPAEDHRWLGSKHATDTAKTVTLDASAFQDEGIGEDGVIPSGILIGPTTADPNLYGPVTHSDVAEGEGHLLTTKNTGPGYDTDTPAALLWHGRVIVDNLPDGHGLDTDTALTQFTYEGDVPAGGGG